MCPPFSWTTHCILYTTFLDAICHPEFLAQSVLCYPFGSSMSRPHRDRTWTSNNPRGKSQMRLDPGKMGMENVMYRMQCVVQEKGEDTERDLSPR
ncbi:hypothetical protein AVEN_195235-1 [Araneus ventricosus]|uniref:Uncharacterized protein n=1 Tax=Araneus ventricosus TaxID=182803 RepID=A0A4Y2UN30_ARAVE|nr:hypothetical protein AVEN_195235-1 [Araneus ventricosus]